ncbi:Chemotaxis protein CheW [Candidatus Magnetaquicoccaceae bacterium FCR-1]|uniref:Chemotaxis protein CheW n=1 Tax=Candidatus Magnetaquiglobus chichijimensis TaxID=3141448 RepID=A0ABQ0C8I2_9PROT
MNGKNTTTSTQYLTFTLGAEVFAVDIAKIREVLEYSSVTKVPRTPDFMCGVINLRGSVVPVVDMRLKFNMGQSEKSVNTCIIILEIAQDDGVVVMGALVDSVREVMELEPDQVEPPPKIGMRLRAEFLKGMGKQDGRFIMILDIDKIFSIEELSAVQSAAA